MKHTGDRRYNAMMGGNQSGGKNIHSLGEEKVQRTSFKNKQQ